MIYLRQEGSRSPWPTVDMVRCGGPPLMTQKKKKKKNGKKKLIRRSLLFLSLVLSRNRKRFAGGFQKKKAYAGNIRELNSHVVVHERSALLLFPVLRGHPPSTCVRFLLSFSSRTDLIEKKDRFGM